MSRLVLVSLGLFCLSFFFLRGRRGLGEEESWGSGAGGVIGEGRGIEEYRGIEKRAEMIDIIVIRTTANVPPPHTHRRERLPVHGNRWSAERCRVGGESDGNLNHRISRLAKGDLSVQEQQGLWMGLIWSERKI